MGCQHPGIREAIVYQNGCFFNILCKRPLTPPPPPRFYTVMLQIFVTDFYKVASRMTHKFLHMGLTPPSPFTQCVKKHPIYLSVPP